MMMIPVVTVDEMRRWEKKTWDSGVKESDVITNVGARIAQWIVEHIDRGSRVLLVAGKGNNGADVVATSHFLPKKDYDLRLVNLDSGASGGRKLLESMEVNASGSAELDGNSLPGEILWQPDLIVDGIFGIGISGPVEGEWRHVIDIVNAAGCQVLSIDCPSGMDCDSGTAQGAVIKATWTMAIGAPKSGQIKPNAVPLTGRLLLASQIGLHQDGPDSESKVMWALNNEFRENGGFARSYDSHKGDFGHVLIAAGSQGYHGAAVLAAKGAQTAQPGLVSVVCMSEAYYAVCSHLISAMVHPVSGESFRNLVPKAGSVLIGPGLVGSEARHYFYPVFQDLWRESSKTIIVDATALDWVPVGKISVENQVRIITPHCGEAARMLRRGGNTSIDPKNDRILSAQKLSEMYGGCVVILKGYLTTTYIPGAMTGNESLWFLNSSGNPHLAQGGAGDVLGGVLAGNLAPKVEGLSQAELMDYVVFQILRSVWLHGAAADSLQADGLSWTIEDLVEKLKVPPPFQISVSPD